MTNVQKVGERFKCGICGNLVKVEEVGGGQLVCCGQPMDLV
jgi:desulfoferrodoxin-like iron-binding protein